MKKPIIGISGSWIIDQNGMFPGYHRSYVNDDYISAVILEGGIPFIIPFSTDKDVIKQQVENIDALILSGGHDVTPKFYQQDPHQKLGEVWPERDEFDFTLIKEAEKRKIPILGICRGAQILNVYHGGTLYQDLDAFPKEAIKHDQGHTPTFESHSIDIKEDSLLAEILETNQTMVNSFHHQVIDKLPSFFEAEAHANDGVIEAFVNKQYDGIEFGVQWHPEMLHKTDPSMAKLFNYLIKKA